MTAAMAETIRIHAAGKPLERRAKKWEPVFRNNRRGHLEL